MKTHYDILEVSSAASPETIGAAYRSLCKRYHPDVSKDSTMTADHMKRINESYETLSDPVKRKLYDESLQMTSEFMDSEPETFSPVVYQDKQKPSKQGRWETNVFLLGIRWVVFLPVGYALAVLLNILVLMGFTWMSRNDGRVLIKDIFDSSYPATGLIAAGFAAFGIAVLTSLICPRPKIGASVYGVLYALYAISTLTNLYGQDNISKVVATVVVACIAAGSIFGVVYIHKESDQ